MRIFNKAQDVSKFTGKEKGPLALGAVHIWPEAGVVAATNGHYAVMCAPEGTDRYTLLTILSETKPCLVDPDRWAHVFNPLVLQDGFDLSQKGDALVLTREAPGWIDLPSNQLTLPCLPCRHLDLSSPWGRIDSKPEGSLSGFDLKALVPVLSWMQRAYGRVAKPLILMRHTSSESPLEIAATMDGLALFALVMPHTLDSELYTQLGVGK